MIPGQLQVAHQVTSTHNLQGKSGKQTSATYDSQPPTLEKHVPLKACNVADIYIYIHNNTIYCNIYIIINIYSSSIPATFLFGSNIQLKDIKGRYSAQCM